MRRKIHTPNQPPRACGNLAIVLPEAPPKPEGSRNTGRTVTGRSFWSSSKKSAPPHHPPPLLPARPRGGGYLWIHRQGAWPRIRLTQSISPPPKWGSVRVRVPPNAVVDTPTNSAYRLTRAGRSPLQNICARLRLKPRVLGTLGLFGRPR